jgi:hypothetical protein
MPFGSSPKLLIREPDGVFMTDRCLTLEDTVEFFNVVLQTRLTLQEKRDLVAFMRQL